MVLRAKDQYADTPISSLMWCNLTLFGFFKLLKLYSVEVCFSCTLQCFFILRKNSEPLNNEKEKLIKKPNLFRLMNSFEICENSQIFVITFKSHKNLKNDNSSYFQSLVLRRMDWHFQAEFWINLTFLLKKKNIFSKISKIKK